MSVGEGQQHGIRRKEAIPQASAGVRGQFQEIPQGGAHLGLGSPNGLGQTVQHFFRPVHQATLGFKLKACPFQDSFEPYFRSHQGKEHMLRKQFRVLPLDGFGSGRHQDIIGFLSKR